MVIGAAYPFLSIFWTMTILVFWILWVFTVINVLIDVFRRGDLSGLAKAGWTLFVVALPYLGVLVYLISHGVGMAERSA